MLPDQPINGQRAFVGAAVAGSEPDPARRRLAQRSEPRLSVGIPDRSSVIAERERYAALATADVRFPVL
jgi:hypothetical protein